MSKAKNILKFCMLIILIALLLIPIGQNLFCFIKTKPLKGAFELPAKKTFTLTDWFEGSFQQAYDNYYETHIGLREVFIRIKNQIEFSLFKQTTSWTVIGKDNYLYEEAYINAYLGRDFKGSKIIDSSLQKIMYIQQALKKDNIDLVILFAPGKGSFHKEHIPDRFNPYTKTISNYDYYSRAIKRYPINYIDFNKWFIDKKDTSMYPLYGKFGVHWSEYGAALVGDSTLRYMLQLTEKPFVQLTLKESILSDKKPESDADMMELMNLFFPIEKITMAYPKFIIADTANRIRPNVLTVADSYFWTIINSGIPGNAFNDSSEYWYYNSTAYSKNSETEVKKLDLWKKIKGRDVILIIANEPNMNNIGYGFIDQVYTLYKQRENNTIK
jgi:hypothetical protein